MDDETQVEEVAAGNTDALGGTIPQAPAPENPAWAPYVEKFPEVVQHIAKETFSEWDKGVQQRFQAIHEQYKPFKSYVEQGVDPVRIQSALGLAELLEQNPREFAGLLAEQLGLTVAEANAVTKELVEGEVSEEEVDPRYTQLQQQQEQLIEYITQRDAAEQQQQLQQQQETQLSTELEQLETKYGPLQDVIKNQVLREALRLSAETNKPVSLQQAYDNLESFVSAVRNVPRAGQNAPRVMPSGSSIPVTPPSKTLGQLSPAETKEYVAQLLARQLEGQ